jgi:lipopolysaccharide/colanic/teichoic acid biosynthesis glycosyltransferase
MRGRWTWGPGGKRATDALVAFVALAVLGAPILAIACVVWMSDGSPVLFRQRRVGKAGKPFMLLKFRTMRRTSAAIEASFGAGNTSRITKLGAFLRASKLDELPQLLNVVRGDMSIIGPRPEVPGWVDRCPSLFAPLLAFRPGLTDPSSIAFRHEESLLARAPDADAAYERWILPRKCALSARYARAAGPCSDAWVVARTLSAILHRHR